MSFPAAKSLIATTAVIGVMVAAVPSPAPAASADTGSVSVFPAPGTPVASDRTTFSFRGLDPRELGRVKILGSISGRVGSTRLRHSDGRGVSVVPKGRFSPGEQVRVLTDRPVVSAQKGDFKVRIGRFYGDGRRDPGARAPIPRSGLNSRPDLRPPVVKVLARSPESAPGMFLIAPKRDGLTMLDGSGRVVWFRPTWFGGGGEEVTNFRRQTLGGEPVLTYWKAATDQSGRYRLATFEILDESYERIARFTPGNGYRSDLHEFELTSEGTALIQAVRGVEWDARGQGGGKDTRVLDNIIQEIDVETGAVLFEWHSLGNVGLRASAGSIPKNGQPFDYFHANSVEPDEAGLLVSARRTSTIYRIDRRTAKVRWRLRGDGTRPGTNDFRMGRGTSFGYQHDARRLEDGSISIFDNGSQPAGNRRGLRQPGLPTVNRESSALVLSLGRGGGKRRATLVSRTRHPGELVAASQGNVEWQENGNSVVGWGSLFRLTEFTPDGAIAFDATFNRASVSSYRAYKSPWEGFPPDRPAIASEVAGSGAKVWASWNGATRISSWKVFSGPDAGSLTEVADSPWKGLETEIAVPAVEGKVMVSAYDSNDRQLAGSALVAVGEGSR